MADEHSKRTIRTAGLRHLQGEFDITGDWSLNSLDEFCEALKAQVLKSAAESIDIAMNAKYTQATLAAVYSSEDGRGDGHELDGGSRPVDPLDVFLTIDLGLDSEDPVYVFNLRESLEDILETCAEDGSYSAGLSRISTAFRKMADEIDATVQAAKVRARN